MDWKCLNTPVPLPPQLLLALHVSLPTSEVYMMNSSWQESEGKHYKCEPGQG